MGTIDIWWAVYCSLLPSGLLLLLTQLDTRVSVCSWCCRINNAASNAYKHKALFELSDADLVQIVETNVLGTMLGCKEVGARRPHSQQSSLSCLFWGMFHPAWRRQQSSALSQPPGRPLLSMRQQLCRGKHVRQLPMRGTLGQLPLHWPRADCICKACEQVSSILAVCLPSGKTISALRRLTLWGWRSGDASNMSGHLGGLRSTRFMLEQKLGAGRAVS